MSQSYFAKRKKARRVALQSLYSWELSKDNIENVEHFALDHHKESKFDIPYFQKILYGVPENLGKIEETMAPFMKKMAVNELDPVELTVLRIAIYELLFEDVPFKVVINEALELSKTYGATDGHKFVNGVLDKVSKALKKEE